MSATALVAAFVGGLLLVPAVPRLAHAVEQLARRHVPAPSGPLPVATMSLALAPPAGGEGPPITVQLWLPASHTGAAAGSGCTTALNELHLAGGRPRYPILLYAPGLGGVRDQNAITATDLASHGYVVLAIDDIANDPVPPGASAEAVAVQKLAFDFSSNAAYQATLRRGGEKARLQATKALAALDRLQACVEALPAPDWRGRLDFGRVGFFGFSFGGATAADAGVIDPRVVAVANLDGWLFGPAERGALHKPYLLIFSDFPVPGPQQLNAADPTTRYEAQLTANDLREAHHLVGRPDGYGYSFRESYHENFSDQIYATRFFKSWLVLDPQRVTAAVNAYLLAFFDKYLNHERAPLLRQVPSPYDGVEFIATSAHWRLGTATAPMQLSAGSK
jgi:dienelactone hydrolase